MCGLRCSAKLLRCLAAATLGMTAAIGSALGADKTRIAFMTDFGLFGRHAYYFVAVEKGYYERENLEVNIVRSLGSTASMKQVATGYAAQLGSADAFAVVLGRANDKTPVKLVAVIYHFPPQGVYVLKGGKISGPKDLEGKTLADTAFSVVPKIFPLYAKAAGIDASKVKWVMTVAEALPGMLADGRVDGVGQFVVGEPLLAAAAAPKEILGFEYAKAGLDYYYSSGIIASDDLIKSNPDLIRRFLKATLAGLKDALADPKEAGAIMSRRHPEIDATIAAAETLKVKGLATPAGAPLGAIDPARIQKTIDVVAGAYELKNTVVPDDIYAPGFVEGQPIVDSESGFANRIHKLWSRLWSGSLWK
jgi:NitT/TauT family transport system substrate-binding protein